MKTGKNETITLEHLRFYYLTKPENLISLSERYKTKEIPLLLEYIKKNPNGCSIYFIRLGHKPKILYGEVKDIANNGFWFESYDSFEYSGKSEQPTRSYIRTDNVLGWIPLCPPESNKENNFNPFTEHICPETEDYFEFLEEVKEFFEKCLSKKHKATLCLRYSDGSKEIIDCEIIEVNKSNVLVSIFQLRRYNRGQIIHEDLTKNEKNILYISAENYLQRCDVSLEIIDQII